MFVLALLSFAVPVVLFLALVIVLLVKWDRRPSTAPQAVPVHRPSTIYPPAPVRR